jgi:hypothetical protein
MTLQPLKPSQSSITQPTPQSVSALNVASARTRQWLKHWNTPKILWTSLSATGAASLLLLGISIVGVREQRFAVQTVGKDAAPSVLMAQALKDSLLVIDANVADELLQPNGLSSDAIKEYNEYRKKLAERLVQASQNITYPEEQDLLQTLQLQTQDYFFKIQQARDAKAFGKPKEALTDYREALIILDHKASGSGDKGGMLQLAARLAQVNKDELDKKYTDQTNSVGRALFLSLISGAILLATLAWLQVFLYRRTRRQFNLALIGATGITLLLVAYTSQALLASTFKLKVAKQDAFDSLYALRQVRALGYEANADESHYLLFPEQAALYERSFRNKIAQIADLPLARFNSEIQLAHQEQQPNFSGFIADQLKNITFEGEREATITYLQSLQKYLQLDQQIRDLESKNHVAAVALALGESDETFDGMRKANDKAIAINREQFAKAIKSADGTLALPASIVNSPDGQPFVSLPRQGALDNFEWVALVGLGTITGLTFVGLRPRLREYSV